MLKISAVSGRRDADDGILFSHQAVEERPQPDALVGGPFFE
jgi:hypothetical protein